MNITNHEKEPTKLLYVDPLSPDGHVNFNTIYIEALAKTGFSIDFAFKDGYEKKLPLPKSSKIYSIPIKYYFASRNKLLNRWNNIQILQYIKANCNIHKYDFVMFASYEEVSFYFSFFKRPIILVNHNNLSGLTNSIKLYFFRKVARKNTNIVFEKYMQQYIEEKGIYDVITVHHGLPSAFSPMIVEDIALKEEFAFIDNFGYLIYAPSANSTDKKFLTEIYSDKLFLSFLVKNNILLIIKDKNSDFKHPNILFIDYYLSVSQYQYLFLISDVILIPYGDSFSLRVSSVLFEAMANNKLSVLSNIKALNTYSKHFNYKSFFKTNAELIGRLNDILCLSKQIKEEPYNILENLKPDFSTLFNYKKQKSPR